MTTWGGVVGRQHWGVLSSDDNMGGGCRRTTTGGGCIRPTTTWGGGDVDFFGQNRKKPTCHFGETSLVLLYVSNSKFQNRKNLVDLTLPHVVVGRPHTPHVVVRQPPPLLSSDDNTPCCHPTT